MDWQTLLRATVPLGAALLAVVAGVAARRERTERSRAATNAAQGSSESATARAFGRARSTATYREPVPIGRPGGSPVLTRALAAVAFVLLIAATAFSFTLQASLADVDITEARVSNDGCRASEACRGHHRIWVRGTVATAVEGPNASVLVLIQSVVGGAWSVGAVARPDERGHWSVRDMLVPTNAEAVVAVRAVVSARPPPTHFTQSVEAGWMDGLPGSRVVRVLLSGTEHEEP